MLRDKSNAPKLSDLSPDCESALQALWHIEQARAIYEEIKALPHDHDPIYDDALKALDTSAATFNTLFTNCVACSMEANAAIRAMNTRPSNNKTPHAEAQAA